MRDPRAYAEGRRADRGAQVIDDAWSPLKLTGLRLFLDASRITGLANNDPVAQWDDLSGLGNHATSSGANRPTYKAAGLNGRPAVTWNGTSSWLLVPALLASSTPLSFLCVISPTGTGVRRLIDIQ
ncbi:MAG: hypothetical protein IT182_17315, partial [Acidobacteria bacterium]|nr:hypothetical protein [Acidobacteriota bacterium]